MQERVSLCFRGFVYNILLAVFETVVLQKEVL